MPRLGCLGANLPFISASCPRCSSLPHSPLGQHPRFFRKVRCRFLAPLLYLEPHPHFLHKVPTPLLLSAGSLRAFPHLRHVPPGCMPLPPHRHRSDGDLLPKTQKNEHRS